MCFHDNSYVFNCNKCNIHDDTAAAADDDDETDIANALKTT